METSEQHIDRIYKKIQQLVKQYQQAQRENDRLKKDLSEKDKQIGMHAKEIEELKLRVNVLKAHNGDLDENSRKELEKRLQSYIREIDKCIAILSN